MLRNTVLALLMVLMTGSVLCADEDAEKWLKFFVGDWTRQQELQKDGKDKVVNTATWSYKLAAGGTVGLSEGRWANGFEWVNISGSGPGKIHFERGIDSSGIDWSVDYRKLDRDTLKGEFAGVAEGQKFKGTVTLAITGKDTYVANWEAKSEDGKVTRARAVNIRVK